MDSSVCILKVQKENECYLLFTLYKRNLDFIATSLLSLSTQLCHLNVTVHHYQVRAKHNAIMT